MKNNWILTSVVSGLIGGGLVLYLTSNWTIAILGSIVVAVIVLMNNPKRRYMKAFWVILSMVLVLNKFFLETAGEIFAIQFKVGMNEIGDAVTVSLVVLAAICLVLDFLERNGKLEGTILSVKKNKVGDINGNNNQINQMND